MKHVALLEPADTIMAGDFARPLLLSYEGQSDYLRTTSEWGGGKVNRLGWLPVEELCPAWIGRTLAEYNQRVVQRFGHPVEFLRGELPMGHLEETQDLIIEGKV